jgi:uncharacterized membrane protein YdjX (TVP38/TMEM64 family)
MTDEPSSPARKLRFSENWRRGLLLVLLGVALALIASSDTLHGFLLQTLSEAQGFIATRPRLGAGLFVVLAALSAMLAFFSSAILVPVGIYAWGKTGCMLLLWTGWILGGVTAYTLARFLGRPVVARLLPRGALSRYEDRISGRTPFGLVLLFQLALPSEVPGYLLGLVRYRLWKYLAALALAELPYALGTVYLGASFLDRDLLVFFGLGLAGALSMAFAIRTLRRRLWNERAEGS